MPILVDDLPAGFELPTERAVFRIEQRLGNGAFGAVYGCEVANAAAAGLPERVALKILKMGFEDAVARFGRERDAMKALATQFLGTEDSAGVCAVLDEGQFGLDEGNGSGDKRTGKSLPFFVMPLVEGALSFPGGGDIQERLRRCSALLRTMHAVHASHGPHRDLKPSNVLVDSIGVVWVLDFGLTVAAEPASDDMTRTGQLGGTGSWSAPEQHHPRTGNHREDLRKPVVDVYSLGRMVCESIVGSEPYSTPGEILGAYYSGSALGGSLADRISTELASAGASADGAARLSAAIVKAVQPAPERRSADLAELLAVLDESLFATDLQVDAEERDFDAEDEADAQLGDAIAAADPEASVDQASDDTNLRSWQAAALTSWKDAGKRGIIEAVTGTGKSRVGVEAIRQHVADGGRAVVVVPKRALLTGHGRLRGLPAAARRPGPGRGSGAHGHRAGGPGLPAQGDRGRGRRLHLQASQGGKRLVVVSRLIC